MTNTNQKIENNKAKVIIYWDYELQQGINVATIPLKNSSGELEFKQTEEILKILDKYNIKTCFAILGTCAEKEALPYSAKEQIKKMVELGHEVGSHTYNHIRLSTATAKDFEDNLVKSKILIESVTKEPCVSFVPPWNKPQFFSFLDVDFKLLKTKIPIINKQITILIPKFSTLSRKTIFKILNKHGFKTYRSGSLIFGDKTTPCKVSKMHGITNIPLHIHNGFADEARKHINRAIKKNSVAVIYAHPIKLAYPGNENIKVFEEFCAWINELRNAGKIDISLPKDMN